MARNEQAVDDDSSIILTAKRDLPATVCFSPLKAHDQLLAFIAHQVPLLENTYYLAVPLSRPPGYM
ncbi:hypothetical protein SCP_0311570 [Sparassis crispa]|uniref:Uncharacterized protein n=1 Tax=Sparassis crispa TaxID=139825 RepID=A0A401GGY0_9APHY|nr:hypothetical protein SCP_0311570 [Sparassis crispa]GBE81428.1 hypothetical protein SCP_0311570 [Sparassis crispa]